MNEIWSINEQRPRERLFRLGPDRLSDLELATILIGSGRRGDPASAIAQRLLSRVEGSLARLFSLHPAELQAIRGVGSARSASLLAGMELGRRMLLRDEQHGRAVNSPREAHALVRERLPPGANETIVALYLDNRNRVLLCDEVAGRRLPAGSELDLRILLKSSLMTNASGIILAHNHPSGDPTASEQDIEMSRQLARLLSGIGVELVDHLVVTQSGYAQVRWQSRSFSDAPGKTPGDAA